MTSKKEITINDLAMMVQKGFNSVDDRFEKIDDRFGQMNKRFDGIEKRLDKLEYTIKSSYSSRIEKLEMDIEYIKNILAI